MTDKTPDQLTATVIIADADLLMVYVIADSVMKKVRWDVFQDLVIAALGGTILLSDQNLADLDDASQARANLGLGTAAALAANGVFQVANNLSEVASAPTARTNLGAAASTEPVITGSMKQNIAAVAALNIDVSTAEFFTKSISSNSTFTFSGATASKAQAFILELTVSSAAIPTWPASVQWAGGVAPPFPNGVNYVGFFSLNGGTDWTGVLGPAAVS